jgi:GNAT superfamily N-acetyltransferase
LIAIELSDDDADAELDEIYVLPNLRRRGVGSAMLKATEQLVNDMGRTRLTLWAVPIDDDGENEDQGALIDWYLHRGFATSGEGYGELYKNIP